MKYLKTSAKLLSSISIIYFAITGTAFAEQGDQKGFDIAARSDRTDIGFSDSVVKMKMVLRNAAGQETVRHLALKTLEKENEQVGDKSLIVFSSPADINGTALLSYAKILDSDDQWLYLPALKRTKRISSANKSGPFVGSEFAFEDFTSLELNKFTYKYIGTEACGDIQCDVVERYPRYKHSGYTKQISWIDQKYYQVRKVDFYDRRGDLLKTLTLSDFQLYNDKFWRAKQLSMVNHQTKKATDLIYSDYQFKTGLKNNDFNKAVLKRIR